MQCRVGHGASCAVCWTSVSWLAKGSSWTQAASSAKGGCSTAPAEKEGSRLPGGQLALMGSTCLQLRFALGLKAAAWRRDLHPKPWAPALRSGAGECFWKSKGTFMSLLCRPKGQYVRDSTCPAVQPHVPFLGGEGRTFNLVLLTHCRSGVQGDKGRDTPFSYCL